MALTCNNTSRLLYQYADSPNLVSLLLALLAENCVLISTMDALETRLDVELSEGIQLDLIGMIVGVPRPLNIQIDPDEAFGFDPLEVSDPGHPSGQVPDFGWSGTTRQDRGGRFVGIYGLLVGRMSDFDYRTLIKARIFSNQASGTTEDILAFLEYVLGVGNSKVFPSLGKVSVEVGRPLSGVELDIIAEMLPLAAGIELDEITVAA